MCRWKPRRPNFRQQYQKLSGSLTVQVSRRGKDAGANGPLPGGAGPRPAAGGVGTCRPSAACRRRTSSTIFLTQLLKLREQIAHNAGFDNYRDYAFRRLGRFDYTPEDCAKISRRGGKGSHAGGARVAGERRRQLKLETLRPWDLAVDPLNRPPLKPFAEVGEMVARTQKIFDRLDGELAAVSGRCRICICLIWTIARARRRAAINPRWPRRGCRSFS